MQQIEQAIGNELKIFDRYFNDSFKSQIGLLDKILSFLAKTKGKQMRPMFVLLCSRIGGTINDTTYRAALFVEMIHTSSLIHDDIVDNSAQRRGTFSVNALWKNKIAVSVGDILFAKAISLLVENQDYKILKILSSSIEKVVSGELLQMVKARKINFDEEIYYEVIKGKTASLLASACSAGAASTFKDEDSICKFYQFGENVGMAFQIKDDLLDYSELEIGKPTGSDIKEKKITLPLLYTLNNSDALLRKKIIRIIKRKDVTDDNILFLIEQMKKVGGIRYAEEKMLQFRDEALKILYSFPDSDTRKALEHLVKYTTERKK
jgi:octaprenyl-diphosphate synthase